MLDRADDVEVIDLSPEDLIRRLEEGKVHVASRAGRAVRHYFSPGNLTALRELALRRTAQHVDAQLPTHMRAQAVRGPRAAGDRVLVCINEDPRSAGLVRYAKRFADRLHAPWTALNVETPRITEADRNRIAEAMRLAQRLGGEAVTLPGQDVAETVAEYARANNFT